MISIKSSSLRNLPRIISRHALDCPVAEQQKPERQGVQYTAIHVPQWPHHRHGGWQVDTQPPKVFDPTTQSIRRRRRRPAESSLLLAPGPWNFTIL
jgi:hypothetical protein